MSELMLTVEYKCDLCGAKYYGGGRCACGETIKAPVVRKFTGPFAFEKLREFRNDPGRLDAIDKKRC